MKQLWHKLFLVVIAISCIIFVLTGPRLSSNYLLIAVFPWHQIALLLRTLSLSGSIGNGVAIVLYLLLCSSPVLILLGIRKKRKLVNEDSALIIASIVLFIILYYMINPALVPFPSDRNSLVYQAVICGILYSAFLSYFLLRAVRLLSAGDIKQLGQYLQIVLFFTQTYLLLVVFGAQFGSFLYEIHTLQAGNIGNTHTLSLSYLFLTSKYIFNCLPDICNIILIFRIFSLLEEWKKDRYSPETVQASKQLSQFCLKAIVFIAITQLGFNLFQLLLQSAIRTISIVLYLPVTSLLFLIVTLLINRFVIETKQLKDENDQFI